MDEGKHPMMARHSRRQLNEINVVPYIDVMLVLLIIFMVTAPLINPGEIELPPVGQSLQTPAEPLEVIIRSNQALMVRDRAKSPVASEISRNELVAAIKAKQQQNPDQPVVISADKSVRYEAVIEIMDLLQREKVKRVGLLAQPRGK
jgi:biopolymer transport protein TolR